MANIYTAEGVNWLTVFGDASQIVIAVCALSAAAFALFEYEKSKRQKKLDLAIAAIATWESSLNNLTGAAIGLLTENQTEGSIAPKIKNSQTIKFAGKLHREKSFGFLINSKNEIPAQVTNDIRFALISYINAWEVVAVLYNNEIADREQIRSHLMTDRSLTEMYQRLKPYMDLYGEASWTPVREMCRQIEAM